MVNPPASGEPRAGGPVYAGLALVALATLTYEILLTRIFSVTMWYHFAFVAISVAMFGMSVGALVVYLRPERFPADGVRRQLALASFLFAVSVVVSFFLHLLVPFDPEISPAGLLSVALTYTIVSVPFFFSGIAVCLALTRFPREVGGLYAADLAGAAVGCLALGALLHVTDGPTAVVAVAALAAAGAWLFTLGTPPRALGRGIGAGALALALLAVAHTVAVQHEAPWFRLTRVKGTYEPKPLYEKWNPFSRIAVHGDTSALSRPFGWGMSPTYPADRYVRQLMLLIDASAGTVLTAYDGDPRSVEHLRYDLTNLVHYVRHDGRVLVIGAGGGRDVLSALVFGQREVVALEMNGATLDAAFGRFADYTGHLADDPRVTLINDEARSWLERRDERFDVIQLSLTDTWAATSAGAFVLGENSLYTVEAWRLFLDRLADDGLVSCSRWYFHDRPGEIYRLTAMAATALADRGVAEPRRHMVLVRRMFPGDTEVGGLGTLLVGRSPLSEGDIDAVEQAAARLAFEVVLSPRAAADPTLATLAAGRDLDAFFADYPIDLSPPTDDRPFFFQMLRPGDLFDRSVARAEIGRINMQAVFVLVALLATVGTLTAGCIVLPLFVARGRELSRDALWPLAYFAAIGFGFMLIEVSQMQRLTVFLGHPTYGLSVVLFALLLSGGLGSWLVRGIPAAAAARAGVRRLGLLVVVVWLFGLATPLAVRAFNGAATPLRIAVALGILAPLGVFLGMAFPLGMKLASTKWERMTPWLWGVNGATSVCASVLAVVISLGWGISRALWVGCACYALALAAFAATARKVARP